MPIRTRITGGEAKRTDPFRNSTATHPLLKMGSPHRAVWQIILQNGNPRGGISAASIAQATHLYHPQVLADLRHALLVKENGKRSGIKVYVADPSARGIFPQYVDVDIELFELEDGAFSATAKIRRQSKSTAKVKRFLAKRTIHMRVPIATEPGVMEIVDDNVIDTNSEACMIEAPYTIVTPEQEVRSDDNDSGGIRPKGP